MAKRILVVSRRKDRQRAVKAKAARLVARIKPFHVWMAEEARSPRDVEIYYLVKDGLERLAEHGEDAEATATVRLPKVH